jgi:hypothetical protein
LSSTKGFQNHDLVDAHVKLQLFTDHPAAKFQHDAETPVVVYAFERVIMKLFIQ